MLPSDELWDKAVQIAGNNSSIYPGTMVEHERVYDLSGRLEEYTRSDTACSSIFTRDCRPSWYRPKRTTWTSRRKRPKNLLIPPI